MPANNAPDKEREKISNEVLGYIDNMNSKVIVSYAIADYILDRDAQITAEIKDDMLHRVGDTLSWYIAQGRIELRHLHLEHIMNILGQTFPASLARPESGDENHPS